MNTIANHRALKARISAGWSHDPAHFRFAREHRSSAPFPDDGPTRKSRRKDLVDALIGVLALAALLLVVVFSGAAY